MTEKQRQIMLLVIVASLLVGTGVVLWWGSRPIVVADEQPTAVLPKEKTIPADLFSDPRFQELRSRGGVIEVGPQGNPNPFEPFTRS